MIIWVIEELDQRGWSQRELARRAKISPSSVSKTLSGIIAITFDFCAAIASPLEKTPEEVFRMAGLLPSLPAPEDDPVLARLNNVAKRLRPEDRREVLRFAEFRLRGLPAVITASELAEQLREMTPEQRLRLLQQMEEMREDDQVQLQGPASASDLGEIDMEPLKGF